LTKFRKMLIDPRGLLMRPGSPGSFHFPSVISYSIPLLSHLIVLLPTVLSIYPIMPSSSSKSGSAKQLSDIPQPHVFETFRFSEDYEAFGRQVILPSICDSHDHQYI
jgi:hypothetical protein